MTPDEIEVVLNAIPSQLIAAHLCCRVNFMEHKLSRLKGFMEEGK